jgi:sigma-B regulation protein RsbU (phosphoserine phosphatase)
MGDIAFAAGDAVLLYSDGISEAMDTRDEEFGEERLLELWKRLGGTSAADAMSRVFEAVEQYRGSAAQSDDMTAVIVAPRTA